ncbi:MAG: ABC transporter permease [Brevinemataceae bacterium]
MFKNIIPIIENELRLYVFSWMGWISIIIVNIFISIAFLTVVEFGNFSQFFSLLETPISWAIIIVGARSLSRDKELGMFSLFFTSPISLGTVIVGKFLALSIFFLILAVSLFFYPLMVSFFFPISWLSMFTGFFGLIFLIMFFSALSVFASSFSNNTLISILIGFGIWMVMNVFQSIAAMMDPGSPLINFVNMLSYSYHFRNINIGVFSFDDILYFVIGSVFFIKMSESRILAQIAR